MYQILVPPCIKADHLSSPTSFLADIFILFPVARTIALISGVFSLFSGEI